jgi:hypothetical protein
MDSKDTSSQPAPAPGPAPATPNLAPKARPSNLSANGERLRPLKKERALLTDPLLNKGTAFTEAERDALGLRGLLPPRVFTIEEQEQRTLAALRRKADPIEKYIYLVNLQNRNEVLFYRMVINNTWRRSSPSSTRRPSGRPASTTARSSGARAASSSAATTGAGSHRSFATGPMPSPASSS